MAPLVGRLCKADVYTTSHVESGIRPIKDLNKLCADGRLREALQTAELMERQGNPITRDNAYCLLQICEKKKDLEYGRRVQSLLIQNRLDTISVLGDHLIRLFAYHGNLSEADEAFKKIPKPSSYTWCAIISANVKLGQGENALQLYQRSGVRNDPFLYVDAIKACIMMKNLLQGKIIHSQIIYNGFQANVVVGSVLVDMYAKCGSLWEADTVFQSLPKQDVVAWSAMIAAYVQYGQGLLAFYCFRNMEQEGILPDKVAFLSILKACTVIDQVKLIHKKIKKYGLQSDCVLGSALIDMYAKCGDLDSASRSFRRLPSKDVVSWGTLISGYAQHGKGHLALKYFDKMLKEGIKPDNLTLTSILKACASIGEVDQGRHAHEEIIKSGIQLDIVMSNALIDMYAKFGDLETAHQIFKQSQIRDVVSWGAIIAGYEQHGEDDLALRCFGRMQEEGMQPNEFIFSSALKACANIAATNKGKLIHAQILKKRLQSDLITGNSSIDMYGKCGSLDEAQKVFERLLKRNVVSWSSLIAGYNKNGEGYLALECFYNMQKEGIKPDGVAFSSVLTACATVGALDQGRLIHKQIKKIRLQADLVVGNTLIDMYAKCGILNEAHKVFLDLPIKNVVSWSSMIAGYAQHGEGHLALECFEQMQEKNVLPNEMTFGSVFVVCSRAGLLDEGQWYFKLMRENYGIQPTVSHCNCIVDLLGRAGHFKVVEELLRLTPQIDITGWTSLLGACKLYGNVELGRHCFENIVRLDSNCIAGYVLMSNLYVDAHMEEAAHEIEKMKSCTTMQNVPARAWIEVRNKVHEFAIEDENISRNSHIYSMLKELDNKILEGGYDTKVAVENSDIEYNLCGHCEKMAVAFGFLVVPRDLAIRVTKNLQICGDCHTAMKIISKIEKREIIIRDACRIHHFKHGVCICGD